MDVVMGFAAINAALKAVKSIRDIDKDFDKAQFKLVISELTSSLADAKITLIDANEEISDLVLQIKNLKEQWAFGEKLVEKDGYKYYPSDDGGPSGEPFCQVCERNDGKYFQLTRSKGHIEHTCPNCKSVYHHVSSYMSRDYLRAEKKMHAQERE
ncbi:MAG: hypothetical protein P1V21_01085 [Rhizobiaceae bacterium]|nr:hypothetical protein [Rhizobiaceae bacterium]